MLEKLVRKWIAPVLVVGGLQACGGNSESKPQCTKDEDCDDSVTDCGPGYSTCLCENQFCNRDNVVNERDLPYNAQQSIEWRHGRTAEDGHITFWYNKNGQNADVSTIMVKASDGKPLSRATVHFMGNEVFQLYLVNHENSSFYVGLKPYKSGYVDLDIVVSSSESDYMPTSDAGMAFVKWAKTWEYKGCVVNQDHPLLTNSTIVDGLSNPDLRKIFFLGKANLSGKVNEALKDTGFANYQCRGLKVYEIDINTAYYFGKIEGGLSFFQCLSSSQVNSDSDCS